MKIFKIREDVFKTEPLFILDCNWDKFSKYIKKNYNIEIEEDNDQCGTVVTLKRSPWRIVWTDKLNRNTLLHELFHLVTRICQDKGVPIIAHHPNGNCGDETAAYLFEFFSRNALKKLDRYKRK